LLVVFGDEADGAGGTLESEGMLAKPDVVSFQSVTGDGDGTKAGIDKFTEAFFGESKSVGDHTPGIAALHEGATDISQVLAHQGFATGDDDEHLMGIYMRRDLGVDDVEEVFGRHVRRLDGGDAIASAMQTMHIAAKGGLPEELLKRMELLEVSAPQTLQPQRYFQTKLHRSVVLFSVSTFANRGYTHDTTPHHTGREHNMPRT
jgi:hypothetical protein